MLLGCQRPDITNYDLPRGFHHGSPTGMRKNSPKNGNGRNVSCRGGISQDRWTCKGPTEWTLQKRPGFMVKKYESIHRNISPFSLSIQMLRIFPVVFCLPKIWLNTWTFFVSTAVNILCKQATAYRLQNIILCQHTPVITQCGVLGSWAGATRKVNVTNQLALATLIFGHGTGMVDQCGIMSHLKM